MHRLDPCPLCGQYDAEVIDVRSRNNLPLLMMLCRGCGFVHAEEAIDNIDHSKPNRRQLLREAAVTKKLLPLLTNVLSADSYGCDAAAGSGVLMYALKRLGFTMTGSEQNVHKLQYAQNVLGVRAEAGQISDLRCTDGVFDFMIVRNLHQQLDPLGFLIQTYLKLKSDGLLCVCIPNLAHILKNRAAGRRFSQDYKCVFTGLTVRALAYKAGFSPTDEHLENTTVLLRKTHAPVPAKNIPLPEHASSLIRLALQKRFIYKPRWQNHIQSAYHALLSHVCGVAPSELLIRHMQ